MNKYFNNEVAVYFTKTEENKYRYKNIYPVKEIPNSLFKSFPEGSILIFYNINLTSEDLNEVEIENVILKFENCDLSFGLNLTANNCEFIFTDIKRENGIGELKIKSINTSNTIEINNSNLNYIQFCNIRLKLLSFSNSEIRRIIVSDQCHIISFYFFNYLKLNSKFRIESIYFFDSTIESIQLHNLVNCQRLRIADIKSNGVTIVNSNFNSIIFENYNAKKLAILGGVIDSIFLRLKSMTINNDLTGGKIIKFVSNEFDSISLSPDELNLIKINGTKNTIFKSLHLKSNRIIIRSINTENLNINGEISEVSKLINCKILKFEIRNFNSNNKVIVENLFIPNGESCFKVHNSTLSNLILSPSFLHKFKSIELTNSSFQGITLNNFELINPEIIHSSKMDHQQKIDFVRELNGIMLANHHKHYYTVYRALEQDLRLEGDDSLTGFDKFIVRLNSLSNGHGTKPQKALVWFAAIFLIHILSVSIDLHWQNSPFSTYDFFANHYFYYLKPLTFISELDLKETLNLKNKFKFSGWIKVVDFVYKLLYAYLLYQFVAAFRKFNK